MLRSVVGVIVVALVGGLSGVVTTPLAGAQAARSTVSSTPSPVRHLVATAHGDTAVITWEPPTRGDVRLYAVRAHRSDYYDESDPDFGTRIVRGSATSIRWPDLPLDHPVYFTVTPVAAGTAASGPFNATAPVLAANSYCPADDTTYCVVVDTNARLGTERHPGAGLLLGTVPVANKWVHRLHLKHWRIGAGNAQDYRRVAAVVPKRNVIEILSGAWDKATRDRRHRAADPWADWHRYTRFIATTVRRAMRAGQDPIWEIQNEPEIYPYAYNPDAPPTRARIETEYLKAYRAIKRVAPRARVIAPSVEWEPLPARSAPPIEMKQFISFAAAHHMHLYAVSWHSNYAIRDHDPLLYSEMPASLRDQAEQVRELIAMHPALGSPKLFVDENSSPAGQFLPGFAAGYLAAEDQAGVDEANRACWAYPERPSAGGCFDPELSQLLNFDGKPSSSYWVMADYARMTGARVHSEVSSLDLSALAVTAKSGVTRLLLGTHHGCSAAITGSAYCGGPRKAPQPTRTVIKVLVHDGAKWAKVTVARIPNTRADLIKAPQVHRLRARVRHGVATLSLPAVVDGSAAYVTVAPDTSAGAAAADGDGTRLEVPPARGRPRATRILPTGGAYQHTAVLHPVARRFVAFVTDQFGDPIVNRRVTFALPKGFAHFAHGAQTETVMTNRDGLVRAPAVTAGLSVGRWSASVYLTGQGTGTGRPAAYFPQDNVVT